MPKINSPFSSLKVVISDGKMPGQMQLTLIFILRDTSFSSGYSSS